VLFLGRLNLLEVNHGPENRIHYGVRGFQVETAVKPDDVIVKSLLIDYFQEYLEHLMGELVETYATLTVSKVVEIRFTRRKDRWAYCDEAGVLHIGWDLAFLPKKLIEYVLLHELCHLSRRDHTEGFWERLKSILPDYDGRRTQLLEYESQLEF
jgi:predicted metal-dependent hydrolase